MKKGIILLISITLFFSFISCGGSGTESELKKIIGETKSWNIEVFNNIKLNMSYDEVKALYPQLEDDQDYPWAYLEDHPVVRYYAFYFDEGKLDSIEVGFRDDLDVEETKDTCLTLLKAIWGEPDIAEDDYYSWYGDDFDINAIWFFGNQWEIVIDLR